MKKIIALLLCISLVIGFGVWHNSNKQTGPIYEFNEARDTKPILKLFDDNWHWLISNEGSSPAFFLKYRTPDENPVHFGRLKINVLRENNELAGFIAYYMEQPTEGRLLFLAVDSAFRGKGYGSLLAEYAIEEMIKSGARKIGLWTRLSNLPAQRIYKALGFKEMFYTESGHVFFEYTV